MAPGKRLGGSVYLLAAVVRPSAVRECHLAAPSSRAGALAFAGKPYTSHRTKRRSSQPSVPAVIVQWELLTSFLPPVSTSTTSKLSP